MGHYTSVLIGQWHITSQNCLHPTKLEELTFQMSHERKLCDQRCGYNTPADLRDTHTPTYAQQPVAGW